MNSKRQTGFMLAEFIVAMTVLGMVLIGLAISLDGFAKFNRYQLVRQRCIAAAQAQLDSVSATGEPIAEADFERLWPRLNCEVDKSPGAAQWEGTTLVEAAVRGEAHGREVTVVMRRYVARHVVSNAATTRETLIAGGL